jgi:pimeloyl-ACP methyl ester carboxylesterase
VAVALLFILSASADTQGGTATAPPAASGDFSGLVDVGGRNIYLECHGSGSPTVVLEAGYGNASGVWSDDLQAATPRTTVLPGVATFTHVCAYDRPGTGLSPDSDEHPSRSDPVPQPRTASDVVADLHALLHDAGVPGPYVLAGHSMGGLFVRLYASTYPDDVAGLILVDARPDGLFALIEPLLTPEQWNALMWLLLSPSDAEAVRRYGLEDYDASAFNGVMRQAAAAMPLRPMPLAVLAHGQTFGATEEALGFSPDLLEVAFRIGEEQLATLVPSARFFITKDSGHFIQTDQPELVTEAIRQVVEGVRDPDTWYDLRSCCATQPQQRYVRPGGVGRSTTWMRHIRN